MKLVEHILTKNPCYTAKDYSQRTDASFGWVSSAVNGRTRVP